MKTTGWMLLFLIAVVMSAPSPGQAEGSDSAWVNRTIGYGSDDVERYRRYQRHRQHRHERGGDEGYEGRGEYQGYQCVKDFWGYCSRVAYHRRAYRWRYYRPHHYGHRRLDGLSERIDLGRQCHARRRVVGEEKSSRAKAQRAADNAWMGSVRYDHGERFQDLNNAKDVRHNCDPSSTTTILKRVFFRCVVEATPCRGPAGTTERVERRYEEETDDDDDDRPARKR